MSPKRPSIILLSPLLVFLALCVFSASADDNARLSSYLAYGRWHEEFETPLGIVVQETVFNRNGTFTALSYIEGTQSHEGSEGRWQVRDGNMLWFYFEECSPEPCVTEKESTWIKVIDDNHLKDKLGDSYRE